MGRLGVQLFSGTKSGIIVIKATDLLDTTIYSEDTLVTIESGPPYYVGIYPSSVPEFEDNNIVVGVIASIWDQYTNPVRLPPDIPVYFGVIPDTIGTIDSPVYSDSSGLIRTWFRYGCRHTNDTIHIIVTVDPIIDTSGAIVLAIYEGHIAIDAQPGILYITPPDTIAFADIEVQLLDGFG